MRDAAVSGDVASVVDAVLTDYEQTGDGTIRTLALAGRMPELTGVVEGGRAAHAGFVERTLGSLVPESTRCRPRAPPAAAGCRPGCPRPGTSPRREQELSPSEDARGHLRSMVEALVA